MMRVSTQVGSCWFVFIRGPILYVYIHVTQQSVSRAFLTCTHTSDSFRPWKKPAEMGTGAERRNAYRRRTSRCQPRVTAIRATSRPTDSGSHPPTPAPPPPSSSSLCWFYWGGGGWGGVGGGWEEDQAAMHVCAFHFPSFATGQGRDRLVQSTKYHPNHPLNQGKTTQPLTHPCCSPAAAAFSTIRAANASNAPAPPAGSQARHDPGSQRAPGVVRWGGNHHGVDGRRRLLLVFVLLLLLLLLVLFVVGLLLLLLWGVAGTEGQVSTASYCLDRPTN